MSELAPRLKVLNEELARLRAAALRLAAAPKRAKPAAQEEPAPEEPAPEEPAPEARSAEPSCTVRVEGFVRPLTHQSVKALLVESAGGGALADDGFWMDPLKRQCLAYGLVKWRKLSERARRQGTSTPIDQVIKLFLHFALLSSCVTSTYV